MLQSSGQITIKEIENEFGGSAPTAINEYYSADDAVPSSGQIAFSDFYGKAKPILYDVTQYQCIDHYASLYYDGNGRLYIESREPSGNIHTRRGDCGGYCQGQICIFAFNKSQGTTIHINAWVWNTLHFNFDLNVNTAWRSNFWFTDGGSGAHAYRFRVQGRIT